MTDSTEVLVTGGTGFLGSRLVQRLLGERRRVAVIARGGSLELEAQGVRVIRGSIEDPSAVRAAVTGVATIFHVAARVGVWGPYEEFYRVNVLGTRTLLKAARELGVANFVYASTPSVVYNGQSLAGADESLPLTSKCPSPYPLTKAIAEREVLDANGTDLQTVALRPHLIWGVGDPHLIPRVLARAKTGRLRIIGDGRNRVDMVHVENAVDAHLAAERSLMNGPGRIDSATVSASGGRAYFITNGEPVVLWEWINELLQSLGQPVVKRRIQLSTARRLGAICEGTWNLFRLRGEPPMTRFVADELAKDHWFSIAAARRDLGYQPRVKMADGTRELVESLKQSAREG